MDNLIIIQARMNSHRLPGKVLHKINGKHILKYIVERIASCINARILLATSINPKDDAIEFFCNKNNIECYRGSLNNVSKRMLDAAKSLNADAFIRITGDSPLIDPKIINKAIELYSSGNYDLVTNIFPRSYPVGQSVEVIRTKTYETAYKNMQIKDDLEHVTKYFYRNPNQFKIKNFSNNIDISKYRIVLDSPEDLKVMKEVISSMSNPHTEYGYDKLVQLYNMHKES